MDGLSLELQSGRTSTADLWNRVCALSPDERPQYIARNGLNRVSVDRAVGLSSGSRSGGSSTKRRMYSIRYRCTDGIVIRSARSRSTETGRPVKETGGHNSAKRWAGAKGWDFFVDTITISAAVVTARNPVPR